MKQKRTLENVLPRKNYVMVLRDKPERHSDIVETVGMKYKDEGTIVKLGPEANMGYDQETGQPLSLAVGDRIMFGAWVSKEVEIEGVSYLIMKDEDLLLKF